YRPPYLSSPLAIHVGEGTPLSEPMWFYLGFGRRPHAPGRPRVQPLAHAGGFREITQVRLTSPSADRPSEVARAVMQAGAALLTPAAEHALEITFDGGTAGQVHDFQPDLQLSLRW